MEYFTISGEHYLAVANVYDGTTHRLNSVIYRWNGTLFVAFQSVATIRGASMNFFTIEKEPFLAVSNLNANSVIYEWNNDTFEKFQEIATLRCRASAAFVINNVAFIVNYMLYGMEQLFQGTVGQIVTITEMLCQNDTKC